MAGYRDTSVHFQVLIEKHHTMFEHLYLDISIIQLHYMVHYPCQILAFGPLTNSWTMLYEAKPSVIKRAARHEKCLFDSYQKAPAPSLLSLNPLPTIRKS